MYVCVCGSGGVDCGRFTLEATCQSGDNLERVGGEVQKHFRWGTPVSGGSMPLPKHLQETRVSAGQRWRAQGERGSDGVGTVRILNMN